MPIPSNIEVVPPDSSFDPGVFWIEHKSKIILYAALFLVASILFVIYQITAQQKLSEARQLFAQASSEDDFRQITQKFPHTVVAGNATLLLSAKLRESGKYDEATSSLRNLIQQYPEYPMIDAIWLSLAATLKSQGKTDEAMSTYQQIATQYASRSSGPQALLMEAEILKEKGKVDEAKRAYENVKAQFPDSLFSTEAMQELQSLQK